VHEGDKRGSPENQKVKVKKKKKTKPFSQSHNQGGGGGGEGVSKGCEVAKPSIGGGKKENSNWGKLTN